MRTWQVERRKRTRHLIELGGLVLKAGIVDLTGDDRVVIYGALLWIAEKLKSDQGEHARSLWAARGGRRSKTTEHHYRRTTRPLRCASWSQKERAPTHRPVRPVLHRAAWRGCAAST
ncbi:MAG: conjugal transfer protein TraD [Defluviicoccus sp.]|nr:MAG: conjugal transfer protein TraD [Defluviicoccus sp.]